MGQYKDWLHYRKIDQQLHAQLTQLEQEIAHLQEQLPSVEVFDDYAANPIVQALQHYQQAARSSAAPEAPEPGVAENSANARVAATPNEAIDQSRTMAEAMLSAMPAETISKALSAWGTLPNINTPIHNPLLKAVMLNHLPATPNPAPDLLPANLDSFIFGHTTSNTPNTPPPPPSSQAIPSTSGIASPVDPSSARTDQTVQRWMTRWKRAAREKQVVEETGSSRRG